MQLAGVQNLGEIQDKIMVGTWDSSYHVKVSCNGIACAPYVVELYLH